MAYVAPHLHAGELDLLGDLVGAHLRRPDIVAQGGDAQHAPAAGDDVLAREGSAGVEDVVVVADRSLWQTPQAASLIITSLRRGASTTMSSTTTGWFSSRQTTARAF